MTKVFRIGCGRVSAIAAAAILVLALCALGGGAADAQSRRPDSRAMTCAQVQALISQRGGVVLSTGQYTFDRYVANRSFCAPRGEVLRNDFIPTKDTPKCRVQRCIEAFNPMFR